MQGLITVMGRTQGKRQVAARRILELGCGTAMPSVVAGRMGALEVLATDRSDAFDRNARLRQA